MVPLGDLKMKKIGGRLPFIVGLLAGARLSGKPLVGEGFEEARLIEPLPAVQQHQAAFDFSDRLFSALQAGQTVQAAPAEDVNPPPNPTGILNSGWPIPTHKVSSCPC